ncbi:MAG: pilus assembly protein PilM [Lachnospiraceae bacterium]|nr:pilus assembly protein PilM [Lachnospiraceae bacterium]
MAARVLSVEIGSTITRISEMDYRVKNPKLYKYFCIPTPQGVMEDGFLHENAEFTGAFKRALSENKIKTKQVVFSITSSKIVTREVQVPPIKTNQIGGYIKANANDYFPIDLSAYELAHIFLGVDKDDAGKEKFRVLVMAAGKDLLAGYTKFANACGLRIASIDYCGNSIYQIMKSECGNTAKLVIKVEDGSTIASVIANNSMMLQRSLAYGYEKAVNTVMDLSDSYSISKQEAYKQMTQKPWVKGALSEKTRQIDREEVINETEEQAENRKKVTAGFTQLVSNLGRVVELYHSKGPEYPISEIVLVGLGADIIGLSKLFANELGIPCKVVKSFSSVATYQMLDSEPMGKYIGVLGAVIEPVGMMGEVTKKAGGTSKQINYKLLTILVVVLALLINGVLVLSALLPNMEAKKEQTRLQNLEAQYAEAEVVQNQYNAMTVFYNEVKAKQLLTLHNNDYLIDFLMELEEKLPSDVVLEDFSSDDEKAVMTMEVLNMEQAAKVLQILRGFDSVSDVTIGSTSEADGQDGENASNEEVRMTFSVECYYYPVALEETTTVVAE